MFDFEENKDFGAHKVKSLGEKAFAFDPPITVYSFFQYSKDSFMANTEYDYRGKSYNVQLLFPKEWVVWITKSAELIDPNFSKHLLEGIEKPFDSKTFDGTEEIGFHAGKELKIYLTATINWDNMYDFETLGELSKS